ncbi:MAG: hypothetical protein JO247_02465 [Chloroflexi bacterium]|nr:hypothetical protein [Chloroflexota bacterium]
MDLPLTHVYAGKLELESNYFQSLEGDVDGSHLPYLQSNLGGPRTANPSSSMLGLVEPARFEDTDYGLRQITVREGQEGKRAVTIGHFIMPTITQVRPGGKVFQTNMRTPIDDTHCIFWRVRYCFDEALDQRELWESKHGGWLYPELIRGTYKSVANKSNDYQIDRVKQRFFSYSGITSFILQDVAVTEDQHGPITDRTKEHLVSVDEYVIRVRRRMIAAAREVASGVDPQAPFMPEAAGLLQTRFTMHPTDSLDEKLAGAVAG